MSRNAMIVIVILTGIAVVGLWARASGRAGSSAVTSVRVASNSDETQSEDEEGTMSRYKKPSRDELKERLTPEQFEVVCNEDTEPPFRNEYWDNHEPGIYVDVASGEPLFASTDKFDSGTGWPSFTRPIEPENVVSREDRSYGMTRTEVRSKHGGSHLGHVFDDGPGPEDLRYCINSASLRFIPVNRLEEEGYGDYLALFGKAPATAGRTGNAGGESAKAGTYDPHREVATLAGGCFWGMEEILRQVPGVLETRVGYTGGHLANPRYEDTHDGKSGHAEAVEIVFDPAEISYQELLEKWFFRMHDPTTPNRQGNDRGSQYRSAIFYHSEAQRKAAEAAKENAQHSGLWKRPIVTEIVPATTFWPAEGYHQKYLEKNPGGYTCHFLRE